MASPDLLPDLFRNEYRKIVSVLTSLFGLEHIEVAEDIVSDTFLTASELWGINGLPENPTAWLYTVAKNKTKNYLKHKKFVATKANPEIKRSTPTSIDLEPDLSLKNIEDSQLSMIFVVCNPEISVESQISLALNLLCGFGIQEIADALNTNKEVIYKRLNRAKEKLKESGVRIETPSSNEIEERIEIVLQTLYLLFNEGYYSKVDRSTIRKEFCSEAMRLTLALIENPITTRPSINALYALMCFQVSRMAARVDETGQPVLYHDQDTELWDRDQINSGINYLNKAASGTQLTRYHLEAGIAYWHTEKADTIEKWDSILQLYNQLLVVEYSEAAALNRTYALAKVYGKERALEEALKLDLDDHLYFTLLGELHTGIDREKAIEYFNKALALAKTDGDKTVITKKIASL